MTRQVLVVSHADADGHIIAEQVRRNLATIRTFAVSTVVDPARTKDHNAWLHLEAFPEVEEADLVFFVDLMFAPSSFAQEADALVEFANARPSKRFFLLDHHPVPLRRLSTATNLRALYRRDVLDCTIGPSSWMMILAALCEKQPTRAKQLKKPVHDVLAKGIRRAAALGGPLPGEKLLALLRFDRWKDLELLGAEDASHHRMPRGRRPAGDALSRTLIELENTANELLRETSQAHEGDIRMAYDFDVAMDREPPKLAIPATQSNDLEAIVVLLELAAIYLTPSPGTEFTLEELLDQARSIGGTDIALDDEDAKIVLDKASFLKKEGARRFCLK